MIPSGLRKLVLELAQESHSGVLNVKERCRDFVSWPAIEHDVIVIVLNCTSFITSGKAGHSPASSPVKNAYLFQRDLEPNLPATSSPNRMGLRPMHATCPHAPTGIPSGQKFDDYHTCRLSLSCYRMSSRNGDLPTTSSLTTALNSSREFDQFLSGLQIKHCKTVLYHHHSTGAVERFNHVLNEGFRAARAENRLFDKGIRSFLANFCSTLEATTWKAPAELMF